MIKNIATHNAEVILEVNIETKGRVQVRLRVFDADRPKTFFTDRYMTIDGTKTLYVRMPLSPKISSVEITNRQTGGNDGIINFSVAIEPLEKKMDAGDFKNELIRSFVNFSQRFAFNSSYLNPNKRYLSDDNVFEIDYKDSITNRAGMPTPARIGSMTGVIQVNKAQFDKFSVPMRMAILLHEFSHFFLNKNMRSETEADLNALTIYLGLGYPRIEGYQAFLETFKGAPTMENQARFEKIDAFIKNFENTKMITNIKIR